MIAEISIIDAITAIVAVYAAILSTYGLWPKRAKVDVDISVNPLILDEPGKPEDALILDATNVGRRTTTLSRAYVLLPAGGKIDLLTGGRDKFPFVLKPDTACRAWLKLEYLAAALHDEGVDVDGGTAKIKGLFVSTKGELYESKSHTLVFSLTHMPTLRSNNI